MGSTHTPVDLDDERGCLVYATEHCGDCFSGCARSYRNGNLMSVNVADTDAWRVHNPTMLLQHDQHGYCDANRGNHYQISNVPA